MKTKLFFLSSMLLVAVHSHGMDCCGKIGRGIKDIVQVVAMNDGDIERLPKDQASVIGKCEWGCFFGCTLVGGVVSVFTWPPLGAGIQPSPLDLATLLAPLPLGLCCGRIGGATILACKRKQD